MMVVDDPGVDPPPFPPLRVVPVPPGFFVATVVTGDLVFVGVVVVVVGFVVVVVVVVVVGAGATLQVGTVMTLSSSVTAPV